LQSVTVQIDTNIMVWNVSHPLYARFRSDSLASGSTILCHFGVSYGRSFKCHFPYTNPSCEYIMYL